MMTATRGDEVGGVDWRLLDVDMGFDASTKAMTGWMLDVKHNVQRLSWVTTGVGVIVVT